MRTGHINLADVDPRSAVLKDCHFETCPRGNFCTQGGGHISRHGSTTKNSPALVVDLQASDHNQSDVNPVNS